MKKLLFLLCVLIIAACESQQTEPKFIEGNALGTTYHITYFDEDNINYEQGLDSIFEAINRSMSTYLPNSDISKINKGDNSVQVDHMFEEVFTLSKEIHASTNGYFDPTVGNLVNAYGFGAEDLNRISKYELDSLFQLVGLENFKLTENHLIQKKYDESYIEFNAIAKGYTVDRLAVYLENHGIDNYLVELGGELRAKGKNINKDKTWRVGLDDPYQSNDSREITAILELSNQALATSGNYRKFRIDSITGEKFVHTINPKSGKAEKSNILSASVLAETCAEADAYATGFMAMGLENAKNVLNDVDRVEAYLIYIENDSTKVFVTKNFKKQLIKN